VATMQSAQRDEEKPRSQAGVATMQSAQRDEEKPRSQAGVATENPRG
jgi:diglucosylglycerate octanoyltransferase